MIINLYDHTVSLGGSCGKQNGYLEAVASALVSPSHPPASNSPFSGKGQWSRTQDLLVLTFLHLLIFQFSGTEAM